MFSPDAVSPRERLRESHRRGVRQIDDAQVPTYGLPPSWNGARATGTTSFERIVGRDHSGVHGEMYNSVELLHWSGASELRVESSERPRPIGEQDLLDLLDAPGRCDTVVGVRWPISTGLELVRIHDFRAYHEGRLQMLEQRSGLDLRD